MRPRSVCWPCHDQFVWKPPARHCCTRTRCSPQSCWLHECIQRGRQRCACQLCWPCACTSTWRHHKPPSGRTVIVCEYLRTTRTGHVGPRPALDRTHLLPNVTSWLCALCSIVQHKWFYRQVGDHKRLACDALAASQSETLIVRAGAAQEGIDRCSSMCVQHACVRVPIRELDPALQQRRHL